MLEDNAGQYMYMYLGSDFTIIAACSNIIIYRSASTFPVNNFYLAEPQQIISLTPKKQQKQVAGKTLKKFIDKECNPKKARFPQKIPGNKLQKKHFTKMQKHVGLASTKNQPNKMGLTWQYVLRLPSLHRSFQPHTPQSPLPTYHPYSITHTTQHTVTTTHSPSQLYIHLYYTLKTPLTQTTYYWSTFHNYSNIQLITINAVTLHTTNPYIYKQTNPPLQQALAP